MAGQVSQINADFWGVEAGYPVAGEKAQKFFGFFY
jgi:hypothetical protein